MVHLEIKPKKKEESEEKEKEKEKAKRSRSSSLTSSKSKKEEKARIPPTRFPPSLSDPFGRLSIVYIHIYFYICCIAMYTYSASLGGEGANRSAESRLLASISFVYVPPSFLSSILSILPTSLLYLLDI